MKRKLQIWMAMAAALVPAAGFAQEEAAAKPLWELHARLDGGNDPELAELARGFFGEVGLKAVDGQTPVVRFAGFDNPETPGEDWIGEVRGLEGLDKALAEVAAAGKKDAAGRVIVAEEGFEFAVWLDGPTTLRFAGPPVNAGKAIAEGKALVDGAWASGWVGLKDLASDLLDSAALKLPETLSFTAAGEGDGIRLSLEGIVASEEIAGQAKAWIEETKALLATEDLEQELGVKLPKVAAETAGTKVIVRVDFTEESLRALISEIEAAFAREAPEE